MNDEKEVLVHLLKNCLFVSLKVSKREERDPA